jgi:hypothetical protein
MGPPRCARALLTIECRPDAWAWVTIDLGPTCAAASWSRHTVCVGSGERPGRSPFHVKLHPFPTRRIAAALVRRYERRGLSRTLTYPRFRRDPIQVDVRGEPGSFPFEQDDWRTLAQNNLLMLPTESTYVADAHRLCPDRAGVRCLQPRSLCSATYALVARFRRFPRRTRFTWNGLVVRHPQHFGSAAAPARSG